MKFHFESDLPHQTAGIEAVCDLFRGQETCRTEFTVTRDFGRDLAKPLGLENDLGVGNRLTLLDDQILANLNEIQLRNGLAPSEELKTGDFTVEMETGTGKPTSIRGGRTRRARIARSGFPGRAITRFRRKKFCMKWF
jgi:type III restriction enzyme